MNQTLGENTQPTSPIWGMWAALRHFSASLPPIAQHQLVPPKRSCLLKLPGPIEGQTFWQSLNALWQPSVLPPQQPGHQGELQLIDSISLKQIGREPCTAEQNQALHTQCSQTGQPLVPAFA